MPTVTVNQPAAIRVRVEGQKSRVQSVSYTTPKTLASSPDVNLEGAQTGDLLVYDANTKIFSSKGLGPDIPVRGSLIPDETKQYSLGTRNRRFTSLYLTGNTIDMDGTLIKAEDTTGAISFVAAPTANNPNPIAIVVSPVGGFVPVQTVGGEISNTAIQQAVANSITYVAFQGADSGFF
jgi:hypothetical protein